MQHDETITAAEYTYTVLLQPEPEGGYTVTCPALPGLVTYGETLEEARSMAADAIRGISNACVRTASRSPRAIPAIMEEVSRVLAGEQKIGSEMRLASRNESMVSLRGREKTFSILKKRSMQATTCM
jgi:predicted RNase H-like HicB family nuclease